MKRTRKIAILLVIDAVFFLVEIIVGSATHSLALVADSFHMLNDVFSLIIALWAIKLARERKSCSKYTYGWQRAEVLGALINGVFLLALCLSIFLEAIQRFFEPVAISNPPLILGVGCAGLASNIIGLALFHAHDHGSGNHDHDHPEDVESGHEGHDHSHGQEISNHTDLENNDDDEGDIHSVMPATVVHRELAASFSSPNGPPVNFGGRRRNSSTASKYRRFANPDEDISMHPAGTRHEVMKVANNGRIGYGSTSHSEEESADEEAVVVDDTLHASETSPLIKKASSAVKCMDWSGHKTGHERHDSWHVQHKHMQPAKPEKGSHSHENLNMRGVFLHVLGDALGNVGVIATALFIWLTPFSWRFYMDPIISLVIVVIIAHTALPLCKASAMILLQGVPKGISLDDVKEDIASIPGIINVHELHIWQLSDVKMVASVHVRIAFDPNSDRTASQYMGVARGIRQCLHAYGIHSSTIQPEYIPTSVAEGANGKATKNGHSKSDSTSSLIRTDNDHDHDHDHSHDSETTCGGHSKTDSTSSSHTHKRSKKMNSVPEEGTDGEGRCLLDCGAECETSKCCGPVAEDAAGNMGHHH